VAQAVAGVLDVLGEQLRRVALALEDDPALRPVGVRFLGAIGAGDDHDIEPGLGELERRRAPAMPQPSTRTSVWIGRSIDLRPHGQHALDRAQRAHPDVFGNVDLVSACT